MKKKILIVEDEKVLSKALGDTLTRDGFEISTAKNGEEGLFTALEEHPDLILLDILMPTMDGLTMLNKLRGDAWGKDAKVIMLTNFDDSQKISSAIKDHAYEYYVKADHSLEEIVSKIRVKLGQIKTS